MGTSDCLRKLPARQDLISIGHLDQLHTMFALPVFFTQLI
jgi:hypothetical protein